MLTQSPPPTKPPNWTRSRIRRQHLISLGIPVNLDEMLPRANGKPLPPLQILTRPSSAPPVSRPGTQSGNNSRNNSRNSSPRPSSRGHPHSQFGPKPDLDQAKIARLLELDQGSGYVCRCGIVVLNKPCQIPLCCSHCPHCKNTLLI